LVTAASRPVAATQAQTQTQTQTVCIDLPGETVQCWISGNPVKVVLRKHRDVFFEINLFKGTKYTVESASEFYSPKHKKLLKKVSFQDGEKLHLWVGRDFKGVMVLKAGSRVVGRYEVNKLDKATYGADPRTKPEPLMVVLGTKPQPAFLPCTPADPFGYGVANQMFGTSFNPGLSGLGSFGTTFNYVYPTQPPQEVEYAAVADVEAHEIRPQVLKKLEASGAVTGKPEELFVPPKSRQDPSPMYGAWASAVAIISGNSILNANWFKEGAGYLIDNFREMNRLGMVARLEKKKVGKWRVVFKGKTLLDRAKQAAGIIEKAKVVHNKFPLGTAGTSFIDGGFGRTGKAGYGGFKRILVTASSNYRAGMKIQAIGTVIDIFGDYNNVYQSEQGSKELAEFLTRASISIAKAGGTAVLGSIISASLIAFVTGVLGVTTAPVWATVALVVAPLTSWTVPSTSRMALVAG
jgi:hypothetical protein